MGTKQRKIEKEMKMIEFQKRDEKKRMEKQ